MALQTTITLEHLETAIRLAPTPALVVDAEGRIRITNEKLDALFRYAEGELVDSPIESLVPEEHRGAHPSHRGGFFASPKPRAMGIGLDLYALAKDGERIPVEVGLNPVETASGPMVMTSVVDIRERRSHEARFRVALDAAPSALLMVAKSGEIVLCNRLSEQVFGFARDELVGRTIEELLPADLARSHAGLRAQYADNPTPRAMGEGRALLGVRANGEAFPVEVALQPVAMSNGDYVICSVLDISRRREAERAIRDMNAHLLQLNEELTSFAYSASHDLKAPLASVLGLVHCVEEDLAAGEEEEAHLNLKRIGKLVRQLHGLVEDVLSVARADHMHANPTHFDAVERLRTSVEKHEALRAERNVEVAITGAAEAPLHSEAIRFDSIADNLLSNALRYCTPAKGRPRVELAVSTDEDQLTLRVFDNGTGIPEHMHERIFQMFERAHTASSPGSGLGLALVRKHLRYLGGEVTLAFDEGRTCFTVVVPRELVVQTK